MVPMQRCVQSVPHPGSGNRMWVCFCACGRVVIIIIYYCNRHVELTHQWETGSTIYKLQNKKMPNQLQYKFTN